jgi:Methane oxygenase PmoA
MNLRRVLAVSILVIPAIMTAASIKLKQGEDRIEVFAGDKPFTTYYFLAEVAKPYLMPLRTGSGIVVSREYPVVNDLRGADPNARYLEPHQRPLFFGHGNVDGLDFWGEEVFSRYSSARELNTPESKHSFGRMALEQVEDIREGDDSATLRARFRMEDPGKHLLAKENQTYIFRGDDRTRTIDCEYTIYALAMPVDLGDTKEGTFGIRLRKELSAPLVRMTNSQGGEGEPAIWGKPADWVNYSGTVDGKPVGIVVFDSPKSFRHPTTWHARAYGLLAANPFAAREFTKDDNKDGSWTIPEKKSLTFRYRVVAYDGEFTAAQLAEMYRSYAETQKSDGETR